MFFSESVPERDARVASFDAYLTSRVMGQKRATDAISRVMGTALTLRDRTSTRPVAAFLFIGPTGVGKTEAAKAIRHHFFREEHEPIGDEPNIVFISMANYGLPESLNELLGTSGTRGALAREIERKVKYPDGGYVLLLDEIEKAAEAVKNILFTTLDEGFLDTNFVMACGRRERINLSNAVIICTSNLGAKVASNAGSENAGSVADIMMAEAREKMKPELVERFSALVPYEPLSLPSLLKITTAKLDVRCRNVYIPGLLERGFQVEPDAEVARSVVLSISDRLTDPQLGVRAVGRILQETIDPAVQRLMTEGLPSKGRLRLRRVRGFQIEADITV